VSTSGRAAAIFDFDHTLAHLGHHVDWDAARADLLPIYERAGVSSALLASMPGAISLYRDVARTRPLPPDRLREVQAEASSVLERHEAAAIPRTTLLPEALECVRLLVEAGVAIGIVSSNAVRVVHSVLEQGAMVHLFEVIIGRDEVTELKPSAEGIRLCSDQLGVMPSRAMYVGDMGSDMAAAQAAGAIPVGVTGGEASRDELIAAGAVVVLDSLAELASERSRAWADLLVH